jgi:hypothetical protein
MQGAFTGPYPNREQARDALLTSALPVGADAWHMARSQSLLKGADCAELARMFNPERAPYQTEARYGCAMFEDATGVVGITDGVKVESTALVFDPVTATVFAQYQYGMGY